MIGQENQFNFQSMKISTSSALSGQLFVHENHSTILYCSIPLHFFTQLQSIEFLPSYVQHFHIKLIKSLQVFKSS
jgi:hypothetical protein